MCTITETDTVSAPPSEIKKKPAVFLKGRVKGFVLKGERRVRPFSEMLQPDADGRVFRQKILYTIFL